MQKANRNKGVSLVELVVVIAILGIISGGLIASVGIGKWANARGCAERMDSKLEQAKTMAMSKKDAGYLVLYRKEDGCYTSFTTSLSSYEPQVEKEERIGGKEVEITLHLEKEMERKLASEFVYFSFDRASGALKPCLVREGVTESELGLPESITFAAKGRTNQIKLVAHTGKHYIE